MCKCTGLFIASMAIFCCATGVLAQAVNAMARAQVPADGKMVLTEYGYRDWGPELVEYTVDTRKFPPDAVALVDGTGAPVAFQIEGNTLSYVASLPKGGSATYTLQPKGQAAPAGTTLKVTTQNGVLTLRNEFVGVQMPAPGTTTFPAPVEAAQATPPVLKWAASDGAWMGGAHFVTPRKVASQSFRLVRQGPAVAEYEARYTFVPKGEYVWRVRLSPGMPIAMVTEEFDFNTLTSGLGDDLLVLDWHAGWNAAKIGYSNYTGEQNLPIYKTDDFTGYIDRLKSQPPANIPVPGKPDEAPADAPPEPGLVKAGSVAVSIPWANMWGMMQVYDGAQEADSPRRMAFVPLHSGNWRRGTGVPIWYKPGVGLQISLPISARYTRWTREVTDDHSPFSSAEHDPELRESYGRREWGFYTGATANLAQAMFGHIGLNRYKDWIIDYPEGRAAKNAYPGAIFDPELINLLRKSVDKHPNATELKTRYLITGNPDDAVTNAQSVIGLLKYPSTLKGLRENLFFLSGFSNFRQLQCLLTADRAEDALACPTLPPDLRQELRRRLALYAYLLSDPDTNPRGNGLHLGNNNMSTNRTLALAIFAPELPDHPMYQYWMSKLADFARYKLNTEMAVDGTNIECPMYETSAPSEGFNFAINTLMHRGYDISDMLPYYRNNMTFLANLTMYDPRYKQRIIPGMGNSGNFSPDVWGASVGTFVKSDPEYAGWLSYIFRLIGGKFGPNNIVSCTAHPMYFLPELPEMKGELTTTFFPGYGVVFRHQFDTPNETALLFRAGLNWGHWDLDPLNVILYGKGAPLSPGTIYQYYSGVGAKDNAIYHNQTKIGARNTYECFGRMDDTVRDYGFGPNADYAVATRFYPSQIFNDGKGATNWNRHVLFLKTAQPTGLSYFVIRDTFTGETSRPTCWTWLNNDDPGKILVDGTAFDPTKTPFEKIVPEAEMQTLNGQVVETKTKFGVSTLLCFSEFHDVRSRMVMQERYKGENKTIFEIPGAPGRDYFYLAFPHKDGDAAPAYQFLAPGVAQVKTDESTDTCFLGDTPFTYNKDGIIFTGKAGAVRVFLDHVVLCLNAGSGRIGYKGYILEGNGPFEQSVRLSSLRRRVVKITGGYEKKVQTLDLGNGVTVTGEGPFTAELKGKTITIHVPDGRARVLHVEHTDPDFIIRPSYFIDGREWQAYWTDYPGNGWGSYDHTWLIGLTVPAGKHELTVSEQVYPKGWAREFTPEIDGVITGK